jgi:hypothetical protein
VTKIQTEEIFALREKIEGKLFDVSFIDDKEHSSVKGIFSEVFGDAIVEESPKDERQ